MKSDPESPFPVVRQEPKRHPCPDCKMCQGCSETRCNVCRGLGAVEKHLSMAEQIALYERINAEERGD